MSETAIAAAPIVAALSPLVNAVASGLVIGLGGLLFAGLARMSGIAFAPDAQAQLEKAADAEVHALIAGAENNLATGKFSVGNPLVATAATALVANAPRIVAKLGLNEAEVRDAVVKAIGRAQKAMTASPATPATKAG
jgi:glutathione S-transferase